MKNVLVGAYRNKGSFEDKSGKKVDFDNINLVVMNYRGYVGRDINVHGFVPQRGDGNVIVPIVKIPTNRFKYVTGVEVKDILLRFESVYLGQVLDLTIKENEYGREEIISVEFVGDYRDVYRARKNAEELQLEEVEEFDDSEEYIYEAQSDTCDIEYDDSPLEAAPDEEIQLEPKKKSFFRK